MANLFGSMLASTAVGLGKDAAQQQKEERTKQTAYDLIKERQRVASMYENKVHERNAGEAAKALTAAQTREDKLIKGKRAYKSKEKALDRDLKKSTVKASYNNDQLKAAKALYTQASKTLSSSNATDDDIIQARQDLADSSAVLRKLGGLPESKPLVYDTTVTPAQIKKYKDDNGLSHIYGDSITDSQATDRILRDRKEAASMNRRSGMLDATKPTQPAKPTKIPYPHTKEDYVKALVAKYQNTKTPVTAQQAAAQYDRKYTYSGN